MSDRTRLTTVNLFLTGSSLSVVVIPGLLAAAGLGVSLLVAYLVAVSIERLVTFAPLHPAAAEIVLDLPNYMLMSACTAVFIVIGQYVGAGIEVLLICFWFWVNLMMGPFGTVDTETASP